MNERMRFVVRREAGERMADLCREFGISRKTGYKYWNRYQELGPEALGDYSRRPHRVPHRTPEELEELVVAARRRYPTWGPKKLRAFLKRAHPGVPIPAASTIGELLSRRGLVDRRRRRRRCTPTPRGELTEASAPNDVWCVDFKGQFRLGNGRYCYPLTITDQHSRFILACDSLEDTTTRGTYATFIETFKTYGLPKVIRSDNGTPFASTGLAGLSRLSVWWKRLGIRPERIEPGHPEQNGRHERMHLTLKQDTTRPARGNHLQQQERFDAFRTLFNEKRPHEALDMDCPADVYTPSQRVYPELLEALKYPLHDYSCKVYNSGHITVRKPLSRSIFISRMLAGERLGVRELPDGWLLSFLDIDLGRIDPAGKFHK